MRINIQPTLENNTLSLSPLLKEDFEDLYQVAADPKIWEQHPNKDRWKKEVFELFFEGAIKSRGAFKIINKEKNNIIGSSRFYEHNELEKSIFIGYTFYATSCWGKGINQAIKQIMLNYIFQFVSKVYFHIGVNNVRSQIAISRLGAKKIKEQEVNYFGEQSKLNYLYEIIKENWMKLS